MGFLWQYGQPRQELPRICSCRCQLACRGFEMQAGKAAPSDRVWIRKAGLLALPCAGLSLWQN